MKKLLSFLYFLIVSTYAVTNEELEVALSTENSLVPIYVTSIISHSSETEPSYLKDLEKVLLFDFQRGGYFSVVPRDEREGYLLSPLNMHDLFNSQEWKKRKVAYVMQPKVEKRQLKLDVFDMRQQKMVSFGNISLTERTAIDRQKIHQLFEQISLRLLGKKGITSGTILYTIRIVKDPNNPTDGISEVWICDYDGGNPRQLTFGNHYCVHPLNFSKNHPDSFLYVSYKIGQPKIYLYDAKQKKEIPFVQLRGNQLLPALSSSFDKLAFISDAAGRADLFLQYLDLRGFPKGRPIQLFSYPRSTQASCVFSPDGEKIAFVSDKDGTPRIYVLQIPSHLQRFKRPYAQLLTKKNRHNVTPSWSSDGTKLAYSALIEGVRQIWIYDFVTGEEWQLTKGPYHKENPIWAGDDTHIIYNTDHPETAELFLIDLNLRQPVQITTGFGKKRFPSWRPFGNVE